MKICIYCNAAKAEQDFAQHNKTYCKQCANAKALRWYYEHKEDILQQRKDYAKQYRKKNKAKCLEKNRNYYHDVTKKDPLRYQKYRKKYLQFKNDPIRYQRWLDYLKEYRKRK